MYLYEQWQALQAITTADIPKGERHMKQFIAAVKAGNPPTPDTLAFFAGAFEEILAGEKTLKKALKLTKPKSGNREIQHMGKNILAAVMVEERRPEYKSYAKTYEALEKETGIKYSNFQRWHEKHKTTARAVLKEMKK